MSTNADSLTGVWNGLYTYPRGPSVSFMATLIETASHVTGSTHEPCSLPGCLVATHDAFLNGRRNAQAVTFTKSYDPANDGYSAVEYDGTLSADGNEIEGRWQITGIGSGKFLMIRAAKTARKIAEKKFVRM